MTYSNGPFSNVYLVVSGMVLDVWFVVPLKLRLLSEELQNRNFKAALILPWNTSFANIMAVSSLVRFLLDRSFFLPSRGLVHIPASGNLLSLCCFGKVFEEGYLVIT